VDYFHAQLHELMTNYGEVFEVWFDGANGGDGWYGGAKDSRTIDRKHYYNYPKIYEMLDELQPQAIIFSDGGPGCRWVGNERGFAGATNWSFLRAGEVSPDIASTTSCNTVMPTATNGCLPNVTSASARVGSTILNRTDM
jgi:alpha-L-fucosidase